MRPRRLDDERLFLALAVIGGMPFPGDQTHAGKKSGAGQSTLARKADVAIVLGPLEEVCPRNRGHYEISDSSVIL